MKTKSVLSVFTAVAAAGLSATAFADSIVVDGVTWNYTVNDGTTTVVLNGVDGNTQAKTTNPSFNAANIPWTFTNNGTTYTASSYADTLFIDWTNLYGELTIPGTIKGAQGRLQGCNGLTKLTLGEGVEIIQWYEFKNCKGIMGGVVIPSSVTDVRTQSFSWDNKITGVWIKGGATSDANTSVDGRATFVGATAMKVLLLGPNTAVVNGKPSTGEKFLDNVTGCVVYAPDNGNWSSSKFVAGGSNTVRYYGPGQDVDIATDDVANTITVTPTTAETLQEALNLAATFKSAFGLDTRISVTNSIATAVTIPASATSSTMFDLHSWVTFNVTTQAQLENTLAAVSGDSMLIVDPTGATENLTVPEGRQVFVVLNEGDTIRSRLNGFSIRFK